MRPIASRTTPVDLNYLGHPETIAACLLDTDAGVAIVDPGPSTSLPALRDALRARGLSVADVAAILLTHIHLDHAGATGTLARENPRIRVYVHERGAPHLSDPSRLLESAARIYGQLMDRLWGEFLPVPPESLHALAGGETIRVGDRVLDVAYTPGHAWHHVSYLDRATGTAFVGDVAGERFPGDTPAIPVTPPPDIDLDAWAESVGKVRAWRPERLFLTHFGLPSVVDAAAHLDEHNERLAEWGRRVRASLAGAGSDEERARRFADEVAAELTRGASPVSAMHIQFTSAKDSWYGLARYWRKRGE